jgi:hypothetical protein
MRVLRITNESIDTKSDGTLPTVSFKLCIYQYALCCTLVLTRLLVVTSGISAVTWYCTNTNGQASTVLVKAAALKCLLQVSNIFIYLCAVRQSSQCSMASHTRTS